MKSILQNDLQKYQKQYDYLTKGKSSSIDNNLEKIRTILPKDGIYEEILLVRINKIKGALNK